MKSVGGAMLFFSVIFENRYLLKLSFITQNMLMN